jgi:hypothetical protein
MNRPLNWIVVLLAVSVLSANLLLVEPHPATMAPTAGAEPVRRSIPGPVSATIPSPFAYIHEDGSEEYLPSGVAFEDDHAHGFMGGPAFDSRAAVYSWSSAEEGLPTSDSPAWR